jgi:DNA-binding response OmpR family regulator
MNLSYSILWIDDDYDYIDSFPDQSLREYVEAQGFDLHIETRTSADDIKKEVDGEKFDLLIIDYNIADGERHGSDVIRQVRNNDCLTEVIFYSQNAASKLHQIAADQGLEGVFYSGRATEQLLPKIKSVFDLTVRKVVDVDNMRGIVMAGVADLDHLITDVIRGVHATLDPGKQLALSSKLLGKMRPVVKNLGRLLKDGAHPSLKEIEKLIDAVVALEPADFEVLLSDRGFDSNKRVEMAMSLCGGRPDLAPHRDNIESIKRLLLWRNALAHQRPLTYDGGFPVFAPAFGEQLTFHQEQARELRQQLRQQRLILAEVLKLLTPAG